MQPSNTESAERTAAETAQAVYGRPVHTQVVPFTYEEFQDYSLYINTTITHAILEGILLSDHMDIFTSRYAGDEPPTPAYNWESYNYHLRSATSSLNFVRSILNPEIPLKLPSPIRQAYQQRIRDYTDEDRSRVIRSHASIIIRYNVIAATYATGGFARETQTLPELYEALSTLLPNEDLSTEIPLITYENENEETAHNYREFAAVLERDAAKLRKAAMRTRKRTGASADPTIPQPHKLRSEREKRRFKVYLHGHRFVPLDVHPDLSAEPKLEDYIPEDLRGREQEILDQILSALDAEPSSDYKRYNEAQRKWNEDVYSYRWQARVAAGMVRSKWMVMATVINNGGDRAPALTISHEDTRGQDIPRYSTKQLRHMLEHPRSMNSIPGWKKSHRLQKEAVLDAVREYLGYVLTTQPP